ncbi:hypothetical protein CMI37_16680 [Candidatus Pacearchaeota archaeon]|jgi:hypothetical protein|nr:hypothetical protein [Candidatus Pacearchaeota archaeon]|tara:strand:- start:1597 stop:1986 length:390 start_codon:yes stop_codon:yes gene_type:complete
MGDEKDKLRNKHGKLHEHIPFEFTAKSDVFLKAESKRIITKLFKCYLNNLEDLRYQHQVALDRLKNDLSPEQIEVLNYLDFHRYSMIRKRVLDNGNETIRDLYNFLENFDINEKNNTSEQNKPQKEKGD